MRDEQWDLLVRKDDKHLLNILLAALNPQGQKFPYRAFRPYDCDMREDIHITGPD